MTSQKGRSMNRTFGQHSPHSTPGSVTWRWQPAQTGGKSKAAGTAAARLSISPNTAMPIRHLIDARASHSTGLVQTVFDEQLVLARKLRALAKPVDGADFLMRRAAEDFGDRLGTVQRQFRDAAAIHCFTADASDALSASGKVDGQALRVEPHARFLQDGDGLVSSANVLPLKSESLDLAVSLLSLHEVNDLPGMLIQIRRALRPDGLFIAALAGAGTLEELRESLLAAEIELTGGATPRVAPFVDVRDAGGLLQRAGFTLPVADIEKVTVRYGSMFELCADLRAMGATNALAERSRKPASRALFARAAQIYAERFSGPDGRIRANFSIVWLSGWAPHDSQQKPLKPGSAQVSLKNILEN
jgi:SAM-dependent methyltransferase